MNALANCGIGLFPGNSYVESPEGRPDKDELLKVEHYKRTRQQQLDIGLLAEEEVQVRSEARKHARFTLSKLSSFMTIALCCCCQSFFWVRFAVRQPG